MENVWAFEVWRPAWAQYGGVVVDVTRAAFLDLSDAEVRERVIESAARVVADGSAFDPLEGLVSQALVGANEVGRSRAAAVLRLHRVSESRIGALVGRVDTSVRVDLHPSESDPQLFDAVVERAAKTRSKATPPTSEDPSNVAMERREPESSLISIKPSRPRSLRRTSVRILLAVSLGAGAGALSTRSLWRTKVGTPVLLYANDIPPSWRVLDASTIMGTGYNTGDLLAQIFVSADGKDRISLAISKDEPGPQENDFPTTTTPGAGASGPPRSAATIFHGFGEPSDPQQVRPHSFWVEQGRLVSLGASPMTEKRLKSFMTTLTTNENFGTDGFRTPEGFIEKKRFLPAKVEKGTETSAVTFVNDDREGEPSVLAQVTATKLSAAGSMFLELRQFLDGLESEKVAFGKGRSLLVQRKLSNGLAGSFVEGNVLFSVFATRYVAPTAETRQGQRLFAAAWSMETAFTKRDEQDVLSLLAVVRVGGADEWRSLTAGLHASRLQLPVKRTLQFGDLNVALHREHEWTPDLLCTTNTCTSVYFNGGNRKAADLLIDEHWWHFEEIGDVEKIPTWKTSPRTENLTVHDDVAKGLTRWHAIDLGPDARLARSRQESEILGRPIIN